ncbi:Hypothetical predicted protein [Lecanosticta acicola]|uniref:Uncharacterized protein n=1 Tax=Lecanosticta acicola TaxID=111012 RepID=A0AAI9E4I2_9PEZI|nr:Hypothetical predicted protein [Lecanosticta acicola]
MKQPVEYITDLISGKHQSILSEAVERAKEINGLPPPTVGGAPRGSRIFWLQDNAHHWNKTASPHFYQFPDTIQGHADAWEFLVARAGERGEILDPSEGDHEERRRKDPWWNFWARRKTTRLQRHLQETIPLQDLEAQTPAGTRAQTPGREFLSRVNSSSYRMIEVSERRPSSLSPIPYVIPVTGEAGPSDWVHRQEEEARKHPRDHSSITLDNAEAICAPQPDAATDYEAQKARREARHDSKHSPASSKDIEAVSSEPRAEQEDDTEISELQASVYATLT